MDVNERLHGDFLYFNLMARLDAYVDARIAAYTRGGSSWEADTAKADVRLALDAYVASVARRIMPRHDTEVPPVS